MIEDEYDPERMIREDGLYGDITLHRIDSSVRQAINKFIVDHWYTTEMVIHGEIIDLSTADGIYAELDGEIAGLITYCIQDGEMEILSLDSVFENRGIGTALIREAEKTAAESGVSRISVYTTNDDTDALRFYQKRGFDMVRIHRHAADFAREIKPEIPLIGDHEIPIRHEIELKKILDKDR